MMSSNENTTKVHEDTSHGEGRARFPSLTIVSHSDLDRIGDRIFLEMLAQEREVAISRNEPGFASPKGPARSLEDDYISRTPFLLRGDARGNIWLNPSGGTRVLADGQWVGEERCFSFAQVRRGVTLELAQRVCLLLHEAPIPEGPPGQMGLVGESAGMARVRDDIRRVADLDVPVLLRGESGSGKELVAQAIHAAGTRRDRDLVSVNLGALAPSLAGAELMGTVRGAFTGATRDRPGYFRTAHRGTLFLDEIGEAPHEIQALLMRVLETNLVYPVGSQKAFEVDIRLLAATDANLENLARRGAFKAPLLHRLGAYEIWVPPLRRRRDDIMRLFFHFAMQILEKVGIPKSGDSPWIPTGLACRLLAYHWPGNVRQLRNVVNQMVIDNRGKPQLEIGPRAERLFTGDDPVENNVSPGPSPAEAEAPPTVVEPRKRKPAQISADELVAAMEDNCWEPARAARALCIPRPSIYDLIKKHGGLRMAEDITADEIETGLAAHDGKLEAVAESLKVSVHGLRRRMGRLGLD